MKRLMMRGVRITTIEEFCIYFSPAEFLFNRELAAGFLSQRLQKSGSEYVRYCCYQIHYTTFPGRSSYRLPARPRAVGEFLDISSLAYNDARVKDPRKNKPCDSDLELMIWAWDLAKSTELPDSEAGKLYYLLTAGYLIAGSFQQDREAGRLISAKQARLAYEKKQDMQSTENDWNPEKAEGSIELHARKEPYVIRLAVGERSDTDKQIVPRRVNALPDFYDTGKEKVILQIEREGQATYTEQLEPGEYCYINFDGDEPVCVQKRTVKNGPYTATRSGVQLKVNGELVRSCNDVISFTVLSDSGELLYLENQQKGLTSNIREYSYYSEKLDQLIPVRSRFVEICSSPPKRESGSAVLYLLGDNGAVFSTEDLPDTKGRYACIQDYLNRRKGRG